jgi:hypothetical protein
MDEVMGQPTEIPMPAVPEHGKFEHTDLASPLVAKEDREREAQDIENEQRKMKGFINVTRCTRCHRRIQPNPQNGYAKCPYCKQEMYPDSKVVYAGTHSPARTDRYAGIVDGSLKTGFDTPSKRTTVAMAPAVGLVGSPKHTVTGIPRTGLKFRE